LRALYDRPKYGDVITPDGVPKFVRLKALDMLANTFRFVPLPPRP
jgi:hypothetical protein